MSIYIGDKEIKNLYVGGITEDYSAMQGPAPSGFHIPLITEWEGLKTIMDGLDLTTGYDWEEDLHMPYAGYRYAEDADLSDQGSEGCYWSSSPYESDQDESRQFSIYSSSVTANGREPRCCGLSVRCFKDLYVTPDSSWTVVEGTLGNAGIFWNQSEGLISITNGSTGYTIMDKNLGATIVYNAGDTLIQANMGNMYQWGNNYGFPSTGTINKTSSTKVDASGYGPDNYYSSDTFIIEVYDWSSVHNDNLWGGVTGIAEKQKVAKEVRLGTTKVRPSGWEPLFIDDDWAMGITFVDGGGFSLAESISSENRFSTCNGQDYENWLHCIFNYDLATYIYNLSSLSKQNNINILGIGWIYDIELEDDSEIEEGITNGAQADYFIRIKFETDSYIIYNTNDIQLYGEGELNGNLIKECEEGFSNVIIAVYAT